MGIAPADRRGKNLFMQNMHISKLPLLFLLAGCLQAQAQNDFALYNTWKSQTTSMTLQFSDRPDDPVDYGGITMSSQPLPGDCPCKGKLYIPFDWRTEGGRLMRYLNLNGGSVTSESACVSEKTYEKKLREDSLCKAATDQALAGWQSNWTQHLSLPYSISGNILYYGGDTFYAMYPVNQTKKQEEVDTEYVDTKDDEKEIEVVTTTEPAKKNGYHTYTLEDGTKYEGEWKEDMRNGQGTVTFTDGTKYTGGWLNDQMHGKGTYTWPNGNKYVGDLQYDKLEGQGTFTTAAGDKYSGTWANSKRNGQGTMEFADGSKYTGEWMDNYMHGKGTYTAADGVKQTGTFSYNAFVE